MPCISALVATVRETHSVKWIAKIGVFYTAAALLVSCIVYHVGLLVFHGVQIIRKNLTILRLKSRELMLE